MIFKVGDKVRYKKNPTWTGEVTAVHEQDNFYDYYTVLWSDGNMNGGYGDHELIPQTKLHRLLDEDDAECYTKSTEEK